LHLGLLDNCAAGTAWKEEKRSNGQPHRKSGAVLVRPVVISARKRRPRHRSALSEYRPRRPRQRRRNFTRQGRRIEAGPCSSDAFTAQSASDTGAVIVAGVHYTGKRVTPGRSFDCCLLGAQGSGWFLPRLSTTTTLTPPTSNPFNPSPPAIVCARLCPQA
jgi:hypothetical protein